MWGGDGKSKLAASKTRVTTALLQTHLFVLFVHRHGLVEEAIDLLGSRARARTQAASSTSAVAATRAADATLRFTRALHAPRGERVDEREEVRILWHAHAPAVSDRQGHAIGRRLHALLLELELSAEALQKVIRTHL